MAIGDGRLPFTMAIGDSRLRLAIHGLAMAIHGWRLPMPMRRCWFNRQSKDNCSISATISTFKRSFLALLIRRQQECAIEPTRRVCRLGLAARIIPLDCSHQLRG